MVTFQEHSAFIRVETGRPTDTVIGSALQTMHTSNVLCVLRRTVTATALTLQRCDSFKEVLSSTILAQGQPQSRRCP